MTKWPPAWLGEAYCTLYPLLKTGVDVRAAASALGTTKSKATLILSRLTRDGWIERVERGRYRAVEPPEVFKRITTLKEIEKNLTKIPQREFIPLLKRFVQLLVKHYGGRLESIALFGSIARGNATPSSDIDILLVIAGLPKRVGERQDEISQLKLQFYALPEHELLPAPISPILYTPEEAKDFHNIYLDMTRHVVILFDKNNLLTERLTELSATLRKLKSERHEIDGKPVWVVAPHLRRGEVAAL